jgi:hypothetical protein
MVLEFLGGNTSVRDHGMRRLAASSFTDKDSGFGVPYMASGEVRHGGT